MPGSRITPEQKQKFRQLRAEGWLIADAAAECGFSEPTGKRLNAEFRQTQQAQPRPTGPIVIPDPLRRPELNRHAQEALDDFGKFRRRYFGRISSPWQEDAAYRVLEHLETPYKEYVVVNCPPGGGKSTLFTHDIPAWLTARSRSLRGFIGSSTQTLANSYTGRLRSTLERPIPMEAKTEDLALGLAYDAEAALPVEYGRFRPVYIPDQANPPWAKNQFTVEQFGQTLTDEKETTWTAFGRDTGFLGWRVNFIVWDDLVTKDTYRTIEARDALRQWWIDEAQTRLEPGGLLILQGQRLNAEDLYRFCLDMEAPVFDDLADHLDDIGEEQLPTGKKYFHIVYKAHYEEHCQYNPNDPRSRIHHSTRAKPYDPNDPEPGCLLDPVRLSWRELKTAMDQPLTNFRVVYQQEDVDPDEVLIPQVWIDGGRDEDGNIFLGCWDEDRDIGEIPRIGGGGKPPISVVTVDPSPTNYWSVQWWIYYEPPSVPRMKGLRYLVDMYRNPLRANDFLDYLTTTQEWSGLFSDWVTRARKLGMPIQYLIFEVNAAQKFVQQYDFFRMFLSFNNIILRPHTTGINKSDQELGIDMLRSPYKYGWVRLPGTTNARKKINALTLELTRYPDSSTDDCVLANWFFEHQLQHLIPRHSTLPQLYNDMPSWLVGSRR